MLRRYASFILVAALAAQSCKNQNDSFDYKSGTGNETPSSVTSHYDDAGNQGHPDKSDQAQVTKPQDGDQALSPADKATLMDMIKSNKEEIEFSTRGAAKLTQPDLKATASMLADHHQQLLTQLQNLVMSKQIKDSVSIVTKKLALAPGNEFDRSWTNMQIQMHEMSIAKTKTAITTVQNPVFLTLVKGSLPIIESHLIKLREVQPGK